MRSKALEKIKEIKKTMAASLINLISTLRNQSVEFERIKIKYIGIMYPDYLNKRAWISIYVCVCELHRVESDFRRLLRVSVDFFQSENVFNSYKYYFTGCTCFTRLPFFFFETMKLTSTGWYHLIKENVPLDRNWTANPFFLGNHLISYYFKLLF